MRKRLHIIVCGKVQGVFFRKNITELAKQLHLTGFVQNCKDGSVEVVVEGEETALQQLGKYCSKGPTFAKVSKVELIEEEFEDEFTDFFVKRNGV